MARSLGDHISNTTELRAAGGEREPSGRTDGHTRISMETWKPASPRALGRRDTIYFRCSIKVEGMNCPGHSSTNPPTRRRNMQLSTSLLNVLGLISLASCAAAQKTPLCTLAASGGDDAPQFLKAAQTCTQVVIPKATTLNIATRLNMTGLSNTHINLQGKIRFAPNLPYWIKNSFAFAYQTQITWWLLGGNNILVNGGGTIDGAGQAWYDEFVSNKTLPRPISLTIIDAKNVLVQNISMINSPEWFNFLVNGQNVTYDGLTLTAASTSSALAKNTDGWDIYRSSDVTIKNCHIKNGDDCVSFKPNVTNVIVDNLTCDGSHGISVGSLGEVNGVYDYVQNVVATNVVMSNSQNGARIKAFAGQNRGLGLVKNITFMGFKESQVDNPVVIDQCYMTTAADCAKYPSNVYIQDIFFKNITGTGTRSVTAKLSCSPGNRCTDINVNDFSLTPKSGSGYSCQNVQLTGNAAKLFPTCTVT
ncbi:unnamed protein product [Mycena citricolor]|uniref:galacturonan 1,4-alpha-galacturonidase n=1 Tax=Mycena citricolor TaxID=2018698 RepID=A0AAD2HRP0_9AGAR|nr:unnamed protein product [Mycena citricolor]